MSVKQKILRSSALGARPAAGTRQPGELYINFADNQLGVIDTAQDPQDLLAIRYFSTETSYEVNDVVIYEVDGKLYQAIVPNGPGPFVPTDWITAIDSFTQRLAGYSDDGFHEEYVGDLDDILVNSKYFITSGGVTNEPSDFGSGGGWITTDMSTDDSTSLQVIEGGDSANEGKVWQRSRTTSVWGPWRIIIGPRTSQIGELVELPGLIAVPANRGLAGAFGQLLLRAEYPDMWNFISTSTPFVTDAVWQAESNLGANGVGLYSDGDGSTSFRMPDYRGEFLRAMNFASGGGNAARDPDRADNSLDWQGDQYRQHRHNVFDQYVGQDSDGGNGDPRITPGATTNTGYSGGSETRGRNIPVLTCIRVEDVAVGVI